MTAPYRERFLLRCVDGPEDGSTRIIRDGDLGLSWPLPDTLTHAGGRYRKRSESQWPPQTSDASGAVRGAEYLWEPHTADRPGTDPHTTPSPLPAGSGHHSPPAGNEIHTARDPSCGCWVERPGEHRPACLGQGRPGHS